MSNGQGQGGGKPPYDDRTLLDPLSNDELRALREARQRMQAKKQQGATSAVAHQVVIGPDGGDDIGTAPTRAMPALPTFDANVSLDQIEAAPQQRVTGDVLDPATQPPDAGPTPSDPMSLAGYEETISASSPSLGSPSAFGPSDSDASLPTQPAQPSPLGHSPIIQGRPLVQPVHPSAPLGGTQPGTGTVNRGAPQPGQPGFGENTLLWMQPPAQASVGQAGPAATMDFLPRPDRREIAVSRVKTFGVAAVIVLLIGALLYSTLFSAPKGVIELRSTPPKAEVFIDGTKYSPTPVKLTLAEGAYRISLELSGYEPLRFTANVKGEQTERRDVHLVPISRPGLMTVRIEVQPVPARIVFDGKTYDGRKTLMVPNVDPVKPHSIAIEAGGFVKIIQDVRKDELKKSYSFVLARSSE